jgi:hypothetical protein
MLNRLFHGGVVMVSVQGILTELTTRGGAAAMDAPGRRRGEIAQSSLSGPRTHKFPSLGALWAALGPRG